MKLSDALEKLRAIKKKPLGELVRELPLDLVIAKGRYGLTLEKLIGLNPFSHNIDFEDGELKTNWTYRNGEPKETIFICQIKGLINGPHGMLSLSPVPFEQSYVYRKIRNLLIVPIVKQGVEASWYVDDVFHVMAQPGSDLFLQLKSDYENICSELVRHIVEGSDRLMHTASGTYLQVRTKDAKPYSAMISDRFGCVVSDKNRAFYFQKEFVKDIRSGKIPLKS